MGLRKLVAPGREEAQPSRPWEITAFSLLAASRAEPEGRGPPRPSFTSSLPYSQTLTLPLPLFLCPSLTPTLSYLLPPLLPPSPPSKEEVSCRAPAPTPDFQGSRSYSQRTGERVLLSVTQSENFHFRGQGAPQGLGTPKEEGTAMPCPAGSGDLTPGILR